MLRLFDIQPAFFIYIFFGSSFIACLTEVFAATYINRAITVNFAAYSAAGLYIKAPETLYDCR